MLAVTFDQPGPADRLEVRELPDLPPPGPGELLVRNFATALNRADLLQRRGLYPPPAGASDILGLEFAGEVAQVGEGVEDYRVGDRVFGLLPGGGYAEQVTIDARLAMRIPDELSFDAAAAIPEAFFTAYDNLVRRGRLVAGERALIHAGASGVGSAACQIVRFLGATAIATAGSKAKCALASELGAERAVDYRTEDVAAAIATWSEGEGVDVVLDLVGARHFETNLGALRRGGRLLVVGLVSGRKAELDLGRVLTGQLSILGSTLRSQSLDYKVALTQAFATELLPAFRDRSLRAVIDRVLTIDDVVEAHEVLERNENLGKVVLRF